MGSTTEIQWCNKTFNAWRGCSPARNGNRIAPECEHCYAETNVGVKLHNIGWGDDATRVIKAESGWKQPYTWNRAAIKAGTRPRVFVGSLCDFFEDRPELVLPRQRTWRAIRECSHLTWMLLTKRPENLRSMLPWSDRPWPHVWLGTTAGHPDSLHRVGKLLECPAAFRYLSVEPLLGELDLELRPLGATREHEFGERRRARINWLIIGAESGPHRRPCKLEWVESLVDQADAAGVPVFVKQSDINGKLSKDPTEWPEKLRRRELLEVTSD